MSKLITIMWAPITVFLFNQLATSVGWYDVWSHLDTVMHIVGGVAIAWMFLAYIRLYGTAWWRHIPRTWQVLITLCVTAMFGVAWEWYEYIAETYFQLFIQGTIADTMGDLFLDILGALIVAMIIIRRHK